MNEREARSASLLTRITFVRVVLVPVVMWLLLEGRTVSHAYGIAATLFAIAAATDFLDGFLARRWSATTTLGSFLDTTADKLLVSGVLVALVAVGRASAWIAIVIVGREILILGLKAIAAADGIIVRPSIWGKAKANVQFLAIFMAILRTPDRFGSLYPDQWVMLAAAVVTVLSAAEYLARFSGSITGSRHS
ncbi:MAG TPA: CDP-diacylglycerol--glycerol-3-phosphate 3-phosphatidyltransferase [Actinomycetota bacterium]